MIGINSKHNKRYTCRLCLKVVDKESPNFAEYTNNENIIYLADSDPTYAISLAGVRLDMFFKENHEYEFEATAYVEEEIIIPKYPSLEHDRKQYTSGLGVAFARVKSNNLVNMLQELKEKIWKQVYYEKG